MIPLQEHFAVASGHEALVRLNRLVANNGTPLTVYDATGKLLGHVVAVEHDDALKRTVAEKDLASLKSRLADLPADITVKAKEALETAVADLEALLAQVKGDLEEEVRLILGEG